MTYIISEISNQWGGKLEIAEQMILQSKFGGADAVKVQLFGDDWKPERFNSQQGQDYLSLSFPNVIRLKKYAEMLGIDFFASPFDEERLNWCLELKLPYIKIGNGVYKQMKPLVRGAVSTGRKVLISLDHEEIGQIPPFQEKNVQYLYTERKYPINLEDIRMPNFDASFFLEGYSDHCAGLTACFYALSRGATIIEKHFTLSKSWQKTGESAHLCSMDYQELQQLRAVSRDLNMLRHGKIMEFERN